MKIKKLDFRCLRIRFKRVGYFFWEEGHKESFIKRKVIHEKVRKEEGAKKKEEKRRNLVSKRMGKIEGVIQ